MTATSAESHPGAWHGRGERPPVGPGAPPPGRSVARPPLLRPVQGRRVAGVAAGLAVHLRLPVRAVRAMFVLVTPAGGVGPALYLFWWLTTPSGDPTATDAGRPAALSRLARRQPLVQRGRRFPVTDLAVGLVLVVGAATLLAVRTGADVDVTWVLPALLVLAGLILAWSQLDAGTRDRVRDHSGGRTPVSVLSLLGGVVLAGVGVLLFVADATGRGLEPALLVQAVVVGVAVLAGVGLVLAPWWLRLVRELGDERAARAREAERADIAAHLHDSVLQTLALIRARAGDGAEVARLARAQERELREWLYDDRPAPGSSLAAALRAVVAEVEDTRTDPAGRPVTVDTVVVGDRPPDADTAALLQATREALVNAVAHGRPPVSLYLEVRDDAVEVFVRDRGDGFEPVDVPSDRFGVRESILGRVRRRGGTAEVVCRPGRGTEVHLVLPVAGAERPRPATGRPGD